MFYLNVNDRPMFFNGFQPTPSLGKQTPFYYKLPPCRSTDEAAFSYSIINWHDLLMAVTLVCSNAL